MTTEVARVYHCSDEHHPFADPQARALALQIVADFNPTHLVVGSDGIDFYSISCFDKDPTRVKEYHLQKEIDTWQSAQREWHDAAPAAARLFIPGNHEDRLRRYLWKHPELCGLNALKLENLLQLDKLGIHVAPGGEVRLGPLLVKHGRYVRKHSAYTAKSELEHEYHALSVLTGHTHRGGSHYVTTRHGIVQAHETFCLCQLTTEYVTNPNWQQGVLLATVHRGAMTPEPIPFFRHRKKLRALWRGKEYVS